LKWTRKTTETIADELRLVGISVSPNTVGRLLEQLGYRLRTNEKTIARSSPADRDAQFQRIAEMRQRFSAKGLPIVSIDTNYDPSRIMDIARGPIRVHAVVIERQPHALIPSVYT